MNAKIILMFSSISIVNLFACGPGGIFGPPESFPEPFPQTPGTLPPKFSACQNCSPFPTNLNKIKSSDILMQEILVSYGMNADGCKFAVLQCRNPVAKDILMEWYDLSGESLGSTGSIKHTQHVIALVTCNQNSEWNYTVNGVNKIVHSATCEYLN